MIPTDQEIADARRMHEARGIHEPPIRRVKSKDVEGADIEWLEMDIDDITPGPGAMRARWTSGARAVYDDFAAILPVCSVLAVCGSRSVESRITRSIDTRPCEPLRPEDANWGEE